ncbi:hypothetical protein MTP99_015124 [Tenebrio molitor]|nr:hypothetical protein MTP99_015124 [Tenebrio molitor]
MMAQPKGFVLALECDIPFALPSDTRLYKKERRNYVIQRRNILSNFESAFNNSASTVLFRYGLNGNSCVKRMICEAQQNNIPDKSLIKDILSAIFNGSESDYLDYVNPCSHLTFSECPVPWLNYILGSLRAS